MLAFQQRVCDEKRELDLKRELLGKFIGGTVFNGLPAGEQDRLLRQIKAMHVYSLVLAERIACFVDSGSQE